MARKTTAKQTPRPTPHFVRQLQGLVRKQLESISSEELSRRTGIHPVNLRHFSLSGKRLGIVKLERLADFFGLEIIVAPKATK